MGNLKKLSILAGVTFLVSGIYFFSVEKIIEAPPGVAEPMDAAYQAEPFQTEDGWGYMILHNGKMLINQPHIPAINGLVSFKSEEEATATAKLAMEKIEKGLFPPTITIHELDSMHVRY